MRGRRRVRGHGGAALILTLTLMLLPWRVSPSVIHSAPVYSLLALITTHGWRQGARFLLLPAHPPACDEEQPRRRRCRPRYHHRSLTASAPASVCLSLLCLHPRRQLPSAHVPPSPPPTSPTHPSPARHLAAPAAEARTRSCRRILLLTCRAVIIVAPVPPLRTRKACLHAALSAPAHS